MPPVSNEGSSMFRPRKPVSFLVVVAAAVCCSIPTALAGIPQKPAAQKAAVTLAAPSLQYVGPLEGVEQFYTQQNADTKVQQALDTGMNVIRVRLRWKYTSGAPSANTTAVCNLAHAAEEKGLKAIILSLEPDQTVWPLAQTDMDRFLTNISNYDQGLFDSGSDCIAHPSNLQVMWMFGNEPNVHTFCDGSDKGFNPPSGLLAQHKECAKREALLLHNSYAFIQTEKVKYGQNLKPIDLQVIGGGLSSNDAPIDLLQKYFQARTDLGYKSCDMDYFGFHPYGLGGNPFYGLRLETKVAATLKVNGCGVPIFYTEMGFTTAPPLDNSHPCPAYAKNTPEAQYISLLGTAFSMTLSTKNVVGYINMQLNDEVCRSGGWSSGLYYSDGTPKPFHDQARQIFQNALSPQLRVATPPTN